MRWIYLIKRVFRNIRDWYKIILLDEHWDEYYLFRILEHKLLLMEQHFKSDKAYAITSLKNAEDMRLCRLLINRIISKDYTTPEYDRYFEQRFPKDCDNLLEQFNRDEHTEVETKIVRKNFEYEEYMKKQDIDLLFTTMKKHIRTWWD